MGVSSSCCEGGAGPLRQVGHDNDHLFCIVLSPIVLTSSSITSLFYAIFSCLLSIGFDLWIYCTCVQINLHHHPNLHPHLTLPHPLSFCFSIYLPSFSFHSSNFLPSPYLLSPLFSFHFLSSPSSPFFRLFNSPSPGKSHEDGDFLRDLNPSSLTTLTEALVEPSLATCTSGDTFQFERLGYFCLDPKGEKGHLLFNRVVTLKDNWAAPVGECTTLLFNATVLCHTLPYNTILF